MALWSFHLMHYKFYTQCADISGKTYDRNHLILGWSAAKYCNIKRF